MTIRLTLTALIVALAALFGSGVARIYHGAGAFGVSLGTSDSCMSFLEIDHQPGDGFMVGTLGICEQD